MSTVRRRMLLAMTLTVKAFRRMDSPSSPD
jgi:hypothetical protein